MKMGLFLASRRKFHELLLLLALNLGLYFIWNGFSHLVLLNLGFVWNWSASQQVTYVADNRRYRFSFLKMVYNLQRLFLLPLQKFHPAFSFFPKLLPAGLFWWLVLIFAGSDLPVWPTFLGSLAYELIQLDSLFTKKDSPPDLPEELR